MHHIMLLALFVTFSAQAEGRRWGLDWAPFPGANSFDPTKVIVEDTSVELFAELPSGHTDLKTYRAPLEVVRAYSLDWRIQDGDIKDYAKAPHCNRAEIHALKLWGTNAIYQKVNHALRTMQEGKISGKTLDPLTERQIQLIASGVNCAPQYEGPAVRMENAPDWLLSQYQTPNYLGMRGFTSTTKGSVPAPYFLELYVHEILIPNAQGADIDVMEIAEWASEKEVLIRPGTIFKVLSREDLPGKKPSHIFHFQQH